MSHPPSRKILVVDDEEVVREVLGEFLALLGFQSEEAISGSGGLQAIETAEFCAAFADVRMPELDGIGFLRKTRQIRPDLPVIIITGHGCDDTLQEAMSAGAFAFLRKPFRFHQVREILESLASLEKQGGCPGLESAV
jgi:DNA-binding NtrC family response regulator